MKGYYIRLQANMRHPFFIRNSKCNQVLHMHKRFFLSYQGSFFVHNGQHMLFLIFGSRSGSSSICSRLKWLESFPIFQKPYIPHPHFKVTLMYIYKCLADGNIHRLLNPCVFKTFGLPTGRNFISQENVHQLSIHFLAL